MRRIRRIDRLIAQLERRNRAMQEAEGDPVLTEIQEAHIAALEEESTGAISYRAFLLSQAVEQGYSKYRLSQVLNVSTAQVYHLIDPGYKYRLKGGKSED